MTTTDGEGWAKRAAPDQRWVCGACGKFTELGAQRHDFRDTSCMTHAVLCQGERGLDGYWVAVEHATKDTSK